MIALLSAALLAAPAAPETTAPNVRVAGDRLECASGGTETATLLDIPAGITRISGTARRTVGRPGGYRVAGTEGGFALRIGVAGPTDRTVAGFFARSGPGAAGPPRVADHYFTFLGRYRRGVPFEFAGRLGALLPFAIAGTDSFRFEIAITPDGGVELHMRWTEDARPREAAGLVPADGRPTRFVIQCEIDDFVIEDIRLG